MMFGLADLEPFTWGKVANLSSQLETAVAEKVRNSNEILTKFLKW